MKDLIMKTIKIITAIIIAVNVYGMPVSIIPDWLSGKITVSHQIPLVTDDRGNPVDYETGDIISISEAGNLAYKRAREGALVSLMETVKQIRIDSNSTFEDLLGRDESVRQKMADFLNRKVLSRELYIDYLTRGASIELRTGDLITVLNYDFPEREFPLRSDIDISTRYTSLIIDARGLKIEPMLLPVIYNENGLEIYSKDYIEPSYAVKYNAVSYVYNEKDAIGHRKAGDKPYFCVALKSIDGSPVIADDDSKKVFSDRKNLDSLRKCRVIFIIDRVKK